MSEFRLKILWFLECGTLRGFPKLGKITEEDMTWARQEAEKFK